MKKPLIVLTGPTAVGKTSLSISLAKAVNGEIISADSMQVYKGMDIGSAKIRKEEMQGVTHYLVNILEPEEEFHIVKFQELAKAALEEIYAKGKIPIEGILLLRLVHTLQFCRKMRIADGLFTPSVIFFPIVHVPGLLSSQFSCRP